MKRATIAGGALAAVLVLADGHRAREQDYRAVGVRRTGGGVGGEAIVVHSIPIAELKAWLNRQRALVDLKVLAALYFVTQST